MKSIKSKTNIHNLSECPQQADGKYLHYKPKDKYDGKETILVVSNNESRKLFIPSKKSTKPALIWSESEFKKFQKKAHRMTKEEKRRSEMERDKDKIKLLNESNERKKLLHDAAQKQIAKVGSKLHGEESEAANRNQYILQRAGELRQEQEDEVKEANSIILCAKCLTIREAQLLEKKLIDKELKEREVKLDLVMEEERQKSLKRDQELSQNRREKNLKYINEVFQQIRENEIQKELDFMRKQEESCNISKALIAMNKEDLKKNADKKKQQEKVRDEMNKANEEMLQLKIIRNEEKRIANFRIQEFMRKKAERESAYDAELQKLKQEKNLEIAYIQDQQKRFMDQKAADEEMRQLQIQEQVERVWREKERANALKRKTDIENLKKERNKQVSQLRKAQAIEIARDREEFDKIVQVQRELYEMELEKKRKRKEEAKKHCKQLMEQINKKVLKRIERQKVNFEESNILFMEKEIRDQNIKSVLRKKLKTLTENNAPDCIVKDVQRKLKLK